MDHKAVEMCNVNCEVEERDPISDPAEEKIATPAQPLLDIRESTQNRCASREQERLAENTVSVTGEV